MADEVSPNTPIITPNRLFESHEKTVAAVAVFLDGCRMVTASFDKTLHLWDLKDGVLLKKMEGHSGRVKALGVSGDMRWIASGDDKGELIAWDGDTGEPLTQAIKVHSEKVWSLDFSPDGTVLATGSWDKTTKLWCTKTWQVQGDSINCGRGVDCVRFSPSSELLAIATWDIQIWHLRTRKCLVKLGSLVGPHISLSWTPDGTRLLSGDDTTVWEWDTLTWQQIGDPWSGHTEVVRVLAVNSSGTLVASASDDNHIYLWQLSDRRIIAIFKHFDEVYCVTFSADGKYIFSGGRDMKISEWAVPTNFLLVDSIEERASQNSAREGFLITPLAVTNTIHPASAGLHNNTEWENILRDGNGEQKETLLYLTANSGNLKEESKKVPYEGALLDAQKVIEGNPSSHLGYQFAHAALHRAQRYDEAIQAIQVMLSKLDTTSDTQTQKLRQQYLSLPEAEAAIRKVIHAQMENAPPRVLDTTTGFLSDQNSRINAFETSAEYKGLLLLTMQHAGLRFEHIEEVVAIYFRCVMLSHRWEEKEPSLHDIQDKEVYKLNPVGGIVKLQSFCKIAHDAGYRWAWIDTCCIDQTNNVEVQKSVNSMFVWYRHSALTIVYLSDVLPLSKPGALARSAWNTRGWTIQEFLAPNVVLFYQRDWTLYLGDRSLNHKKSVRIMQELALATGINPRALVAFRPEMRGAREKLLWASTRVTTFQEDVAYSLFGIFGVYLHVIYGETKQNALGRLLQEIVARSGDITCLDWVGKPSEFNSCLPAHIISYKVPPYTPPPLSEDDIQTSVSWLRNGPAAELASNLYTKLQHMTAPRFAQCRLRLPCIIFPVTEIRRRQNQDQEAHYTCKIKAGGLNELLITTKDRLSQFSRSRPTQQTFLLVRPWDRSLLESPDFANDTHSVNDMRSMDALTLSGSMSSDSLSLLPAGYGTSDSELHPRALRLVVRLGQPFSAFLLAQQRGGEYKRIASDHNIIARVKDMASVHHMLDVRTLEIL